PPCTPTATPPQPPSSPPPPPILGRKNCKTRHQKSHERTEASLSPLLGSWGYKIPSYSSSPLSLLALHQPMAFVFLEAESSERA
uniref:Uncharacterized protein n=1 Tax=Oryza brachyantha TaxID=4533 RepID=J3NDV8_ORYBR